MANGVRPLEVVADVQDDLASPGFLDEADELSELFLDLCRTRSGTAVAGQLEVNRGREGVALGGATSRKWRAWSPAGVHRVK